MNHTGYIWKLSTFKMWLVLQVTYKSITNQLIKESLLDYEMQLREYGNQISLFLSPAWLLGSHNYNFEFKFITKMGWT